MDEIKSCVNCGYHGCNSKDGKRYPEFCLTKELSAEKRECVRQIYADPRTVDGRLTAASTLTDSEFYCQYTRVEETIVFIKKMGFQKVGVAFCAGLIKEAEIFSRIVRLNELQCAGVICKVGEIDKTEMGFAEKIKHNPGCPEALCNPIVQAQYLNEWGAEINVVIGLCVGHDSIFYRHSEAPVTTLLAKDRVLGHNPAAALYTAEGFYAEKLKNIKVGTILNP